MSNKGQKALAAQVAQLRAEVVKYKNSNFRLHNEIRVLQSVQLSMLEPSYFKAKRAWRKKWRNYRKS